MGSLDWWLHAIHLGGVIFWVGSMVFLTVVVMPVGRASFSRTEFLALVHVLGVKFRNISWGLLPLVVGTGVWKAVRVLGSWEALTETPYGRRLMWKSAFVLAALAVSGAHDFVIGPRLTSPRTPEGALARWRWLGRFSGILLLGLVAVIIGLAVSLRVSQLPTAD